MPIYVDTTNDPTIAKKGGYLGGIGKRGEVSPIVETHTYALLPVSLCQSRCRLTSLGQNDNLVVLVRKGSPNVICGEPCGSPSARKHAMDKINAITEAQVFDYERVPG